MKKDEDDIFLHEVEVIVENSTDETARQLTDDIFKVSHQLNALRQIARIQTATDYEGSDLHKQVDRLQTSLCNLNLQYMRLHNMQLESASRFISPLGNTPD